MKPALSIVQSWILNPEPASLSLEVEIAVFISLMPSALDMFGTQSASNTPKEKGEPEPKERKLSSLYKVPNISMP